MVAVATEAHHGRMKFTYVVPRSKVKGVKYVTNHHYVELEDQEERTLHLPATGLMRHECQECANEWFTKSNNSSFCPSCSSQKVERTWGNVQLAFIPENEEDFTPVAELIHTAPKQGDLTEEVVDVDGSEE